MSDYRLGVLGGMGPQATNTFYQYIIDRTAARTDQEHISMLIFSDNEVPDRTAAILSGEENPVYDVPCNTAHYFLDKVQEQISIPILHMVGRPVRSWPAGAATIPACWVPTARSRRAFTKRSSSPWAWSPESPPPRPRKK